MRSLVYWKSVALSSSLCFLFPHSYLARRDETIAHLLQYHVNDLLQQTLQLLRLGSELARPPIVLMRRYVRGGEHPDPRVDQKQRQDLAVPWLGRVSRPDGQPLVLHNVGLHQHLAHVHGDRSHLLDVGAYEGEAEDFLDGFAAAGIVVPLTVIFQKCCPEHRRDTVRGRLCRRRSRRPLLRCAR